MLTDTFLIFGQSEPPAALIPLRAGPLTMLFDPTSGFVRRIKLGEREVLRGIYAAVRDRNWGTPPGVLRESVREVEARSFRIEFESEHRQGDIHFVWRGTLRGDADGTLRYEFDAEAKTTFLRNRIGFCVLHPIRECAGARARQTRTDGSAVECRFPELIEPQIFGQSSFRDLRGVAYEIAEGLWAELEFAGDTFEMEDQRNWTDAGFKTYCTPLALPFPVEVKAGSRVQQAVTLRLVGNAAKASAAEIEVVSRLPEVVRLVIPTAPTTRLPAIGLGVASHGQRLSAQEVDILRQLRPSHLRLDLRLATEGWQAKLEQAAAEAEQLGARLELAIHLPPKGEVDSAAIARALERQAAAFGRVLPLREGKPATSVATLARVRGLLGAIRVPVGCGSDCNFCELNREHALGRLGLAEADFVFWSVNPQVHAYDQHSIMETLEAQAATVHSARAFAGSRPLVVTPVTLKQRFNPVATGAASTAPPGELPSQVDPRQLSQFAAAWTLGSIAALASAGVASVTYFETTGWRGLMERAAGSPLPEKFPSPPGAMFPVGHTLLQLAGFSQLAIVPSVAGKDLTALSFFAGTRPSHLLLANHTDLPRTVRIVVSELPARRVQLGPYEVRRVALSGGDGK